MNTKLVAVVLPLLDADASALSILNDEELRGYGGVVQRDGNSYRLLTTGRMAVMAVEAEDPLLLRLSGVDGTSMLPVPTDKAAAAGFDYVDPQPAAVDSLCRELQTSLLLGPRSFGRSGQPMVTAYLDSNFNFELARRVYTCSVKQESYDEKQYVLYRGKCPMHRNGVLS